MIPIYWNGSLLSPANKYIDGNDHRSLLSSNQSSDGIINTTLNSARSSSIPVCLFPSTRRVIDAGDDSDQNMDIPKYRLFFLYSGGRGKTEIKVCKRKVYPMSRQEYIEPCLPDDDKPRSPTSGQRDGDDIHFDVITQGQAGCTPSLIFQALHGVSRSSSQCFILSTCCDC